MEQTRQSEVQSRKTRDDTEALVRGRNRRAKTVEVESQNDWIVCFKNTSPLSIGQAAAKNLRWRAHFPNTRLERLLSSRVAVRRPPRQPSMHRHGSSKIRTSSTHYRASASAGAVDHGSTLPFPRAAFMLVCCIHLSRFALEYTGLAICLVACWFRFGRLERLLTHSRSRPKKDSMIQMLTPVPSRQHTWP